MKDSLSRDPWQAARRFTSARIALGRAGGSLPTRELLDFQLAHAAARDAVHLPFDPAALADHIKKAGYESLILESAAADCQTYLQRPDLGRRLSVASRDILQKSATGFDVVLIVSDGLSALAANQNAARVLEALRPLLQQSRLTYSPVAIVKLGRVAIEDEIGELLKGQVGVILLGERPGLGSPDSLGAYLVYRPRLGLTDANRNCISNIRPEGLPPAIAAERIFYLIKQMIRRQISGVQLKDDAELPRRIS